MPCFRELKLLRTIKASLAKNNLLISICIFILTSPLITISALHAEESAITNNTATVVPTTASFNTSINDYSLSPLCRSSAPKTNPVKNKNDDKIHLQSDKVNMSQENITTFTGDVIIKQNDQILTSDTAVYSKKTQDLTATGDVKLIKGGLELTGEALQMNLNTNLGHISNARYHNVETQSQGTAKKIEIKSEIELFMEDATYTSCSGDEPDWEVSSSTLTLNKETHQGSASNVVIRFKDVPFLYLPYIQFPIGEERLSGFLFTSFGTSNKFGTELSTPYYWNIAPQVDATITPHYMEKQGLQLQTQLRYLTKESKGKLQVDYLPNDSVTNTDRAFIRWQHTANPTGGWSGNVDYSYASDKQYLNDFSRSLDTASKTNLQRVADVRYDAKNWVFRGRTQSFQILSGNEQVKRLPQLNFNTRQLIKPNEINTSFQSELVRFDHSSLKPIGDRLVLQPSISLPLKNAAAYTTFLTSLHYTQYNLDRTQTGEDQTPNRSVPIVSVNSGVFFERDSSLFGKKYLQTVEPRLQYLYIPYREQGQLPLFDTTTVSNNVDQLFSDNRYSGADRINDANQITYGITSRYINQDTGSELFTGSLAQTYYFANSQVNLNGQQVRKASWSNAEVLLTVKPFKHLKLTSALTRNQQTRKIDRRDLRIQYKSDKNHIINVNYRFLRDQTETRELSTIWRITPQWNLIARQHQDLRQNRELESVYGVQFDSCCWGLRLVQRRYYSEAFQGNPYQKTLFIEFELKGFSSFGQKKQIDSFLKRGILGYSN